MSTVIKGVARWIGERIARWTSLALNIYNCYLCQGSSRRHVTSLIPMGRRRRLSINCCKKIKASALLEVILILHYGRRRRLWCRSLELILQCVYGKVQRNVVDNYCGQLPHVFNQQELSKVITLFSTSVLSFLPSDLLAAISTQNNYYKRSMEFMYFFTGVALYMCSLALTSMNDRSNKQQHEHAFDSTYLQHIEQGRSTHNYSLEVVYYNNDGVERSNHRLTNGCVVHPKR